MLSLNDSDWAMWNSKGYAIVSVILTVWDSLSGWRTLYDCLLLLPTRRMMHGPMWRDYRLWIH